MDNETHTTAVTREELAQKFPEFIAALKAEAIAEERARIRKILALTPMRQRALGFTLAFDEPCSPDEAALRFLEAAHTQGGGSPFARGH